MKNIVLPPLHGSESVPAVPRDYHISLVGAGGSGKSRFMEEMIRRAGSTARPVGPVDESFPAVPLALQAEFSDFIEAEAVKDSPLFKRIRDVWEDLFHTSRMVVTEEGRLRFKTVSGTDLIDLGRLSRGERAGLYYVAKVLTAPRRGVIFVDSPTLFVHPTTVGPLWDRLEHLRPDCRFVYDSTDPAFVGSRMRTVVVWIKKYHSEDETWDYEILPADKSGPAFVDLIGSRRPVLFIEGDADHSIDARLYKLVFPDYTVRPLGSCDKVIETTRTFRYLKQYHPLETLGIVDRDRRSESEVKYLRMRSVMVAEVAEVENIFLTEEVIRIMARANGLDPERTFRKVREIVLSFFERMADAQALQHTRHRMKRDVERKIDARFTCITALELHIKGLIHTLHPRETYQELTREFHAMLRRGDYAAILKVFNHKPLLTSTAIPSLLGYATADDYVEGVLRTLRSDPVHGPLLREAVKGLFTAPDEGGATLDKMPDKTADRHAAKPAPRQNPTPAKQKKRHRKALKEGLVKPASSKKRYKR